MNRWLLKPTAVIWAAVLSVLGLVTTPTARANVTLTDQNSVVNIDPTSQAGVYHWTVDGINQLYQQWFWYRIRNTGGQSSVDTISAPVLNQTAPDAVGLAYQNASIRAEVKYDLTGGSPGDGRSDLSETVRITNVSRSSLTYHFFEYSDFDLGGRPSGDIARITTVGGRAFIADQTKANGSFLSETVAAPGANRWEANLFANTLNSLNSGLTYNLNDHLVAGPGDATWAFQWDFTLGAGQSFLLSKDKLLFTPEPSSIAIAGLGVLGLIGYGIRRRRGV
jgi:hypothetical protein